MDNINNLDSAPIQEQFKVDLGDTVNPSSIYIPKNFIHKGKSSADIVHEDDVYEEVTIYECEVDDDTITMINSMQDNIPFL